MGRHTSVWVTNFGSGILSKIDESTDAVTGPFSVGTNPDGIAFDGRYMWVANQGSHTLSRVDTTTNAIVDPESLLGGAPSQVAFDGQDVWISEGASVRRIDPATGSYGGNVVPVGAFRRRWSLTAAGSGLPRPARHSFESTGGATK